MLFNHQHIAILASISTLINALPLATKPQQIAPRQKNYSVINVDGGSTQPVQLTTVVKPIKTVEVVNPGPTVTQQVTTTVAVVAPAPTATSSSSRSTSSTSSSTTTTGLSTSTPIPTPKPIFVTVTVPKDDGPTEYYDDGKWKTYYRIKTTVDAAVPTAALSTSTFTVSSTVQETTASP